MKTFLSIRIFLEFKKFLKGKNSKGWILRSKSFPKMSMILKNRSVFNFLQICFNKVYFLEPKLSFFGQSFIFRQNIYIFSFFPVLIPKFSNL